MDPWNEPSGSKWMNWMELGLIEDGPWNDGGMSGRDDPRDSLDSRADGTRKRHEIGRVWFRSINPSLDDPFAA